MTLNHSHDSQVTISGLDLLVLLDGDVGEYTAAFAEYDQRNLRSQT